jgi:hypothetical protein
MEEGNEARFNGEAHVSIDPSNYFLAGERTVIQLRIRPEKPDGILVVAGNADRGGEFLTLCLQGGRLILRSVVHTVTVPTGGVRQKQRFFSCGPNFRHRCNRELLW